MKTVIHWKNFAICVTATMAVAGVWIFISNAFDFHDIFKGAGAALVGYAGMQLAMSVWPTYHFE